MALTSYEIDILRLIQKKEKATPAEIVEHYEYGSAMQVTVRKCLMRLEEQGFLSSDLVNEKRGIRAYALTANGRKLNYEKLEK